MTTLRALVVDDHRMTAHALAESLSHRGTEVVAVCHSVGEAVTSLREQPCDVVVTDLDLGPGPTGSDLAHFLHQHHSSLAVVLLTAYEDPKLLDAGFPALPPHVVYVVKQQLVRVDDLVASMHLAVSYVTGQVEPPESKKFPLTRSQAQVLRLVAQGLTNQAMAKELVMSVDSVQTAIKRLARHFDIKQDSETNVRVALTQHYFDLVGFQRER